VTSSQLGGDAGRVQQTTDPRGLVGKTDYDPLGRTVRTIAAFTNGICLPRRNCGAGLA
jgi:YD repeat-containing protein